jgi:cell division transport system ATP-binding protein
MDTTVVLASHNKSIVDKVNKRVVELENGKIIRDSMIGKYNV